MACEHCQKVWDWQQRSTSWPAKYFTPSDAPGQYDGDPGPCPCGCHDIWRLWRRLIGS